MLLSLQKKVGGATFIVVVTYVIMAICVMWKVALENRTLVVGSICVVVNILMYASPLTAMVQILLQTTKWWKLSDSE